MKTRVNAQNLTSSPYIWFSRFLGWIVRNPRVHPNCKFCDSPKKWQFRLEIENSEISRISTLQKCSEENVRMGPQNRLVVFHRLEIRGSAVTDPVKRQGWTDKRDKHPWQLWFTFIEILKIFNHDNPKHVHFLYILPQNRPPKSTLIPSSPICWLIPHDSWVMSHHQKKP